MLAGGWWRWVNNRKKSLENREVESESERAENKGAWRGLLEWWCG